MVFNDKFFFDIGFFFDKIREGQKTFMSEEILAIENKQNLLVQAPTGIGKTLASLCPAIYLSKKLDKKVLFLTSRQTQVNHIIKTIREISNKLDERIKYSVFIAKKDMCAFKKVKKSDFNDFCKEKKDKKECEYFLNTYDDTISHKRDEVLENSYDNFNSVEDFNNFVLEKKSFYVESLEKTKNLCFCPYEMMSLNSLISDIIICDYNYVFKKKFLEILLGKTNSRLEDFILIVDEAHNLIDRVRNLYIQTFDFETIKNFSIELNKFIQNKSFDKYILIFKNTLQKVFEKKRKEHTFEYEVFREEFFLELNDNFHTKDFDENFTQILEDLKTISKIVLQVRTKSYAKKIYDFLVFFDKLNSKSFVSILEIENENKINFNIKIQIKLLDPKIISSSILNGTHSSILMSATLSPINMYGDILGIENYKSLNLESPFSKENHLVLVDTKTTTKYSLRTKEMIFKIAKNVESILKSQDKNTIIFFPSYDFLNKVLENIKINSFEKKVLTESRKMTKEQKEFFLNEFNKKSFLKVCLFAVSNGNFSEGIDLKESSLEVVVVVGIPLAPPNLFIKNIIKYFDEKYRKGLEYGYTNPAMTKIIQAGGRCIRTENDRGIIILMDNRFLSQTYTKCFPSFWNLKQSFDLENEIKEFFKI